MENEINSFDRKKRPFKKVVFIFAFVALLFCVIAGAFFAYKYIFPNKKELFLVAHMNLYNEYKEKEMPDKFTQTTDISLDFNGDFTSKNVLDKAKTLNLRTKKTKIGDEKESFNLILEFLNRNYITSESVRVGETTVLTIPEFIDKSYASDDAEDVLSMLFGAETSGDDVDIFDNVDEERFEKYLKEYSRKVYKNAPEDSFILAEDNGIKTITFKADVDRLLYEIVNEIKNDIELRDFLYNQTEIVVSNLNKKYPYASSLFTVPSKEEFDSDYKESLENFIKSIENSKITVISTIGKGRRIVKETVICENDEEKQFEITYSEKMSRFIYYNDGKEHLTIDINNSENGTIQENRTVISCDVNDFTKEKVSTQKKVSVILDKKLDTNVEGNITLPEKYIDIKTMTKEEKENDISTVNENITELLTSVTLELLSVFS